MRNFIILVTFILFVGCGANDLTFHKISGKNINDLSGKWTVINYWADWCPPCIKEMPELAASLIIAPTLPAISG